jgi:hypothetical protein
MLYAYSWTDLWSRVIVLPMNQWWAKTCLQVVYITVGEGSSKQNKLGFY